MEAARPVILRLEPDPLAVTRVMSPAPAGSREISPAVVVVRFKACEEAAAIDRAPPAGPVILAPSFASTKVRLPTEDTCNESVPSPISRREDGEVSPIPTLPFTSILMRSLVSEPLVKNLIPPADVARALKTIPPLLVESPRIKAESLRPAGVALAGAAPKKAIAESDVARKLANALVPVVAF